MIVLHFRARRSGVDRFLGMEEASGSIPDVSILLIASFSPLCRHLRLRKSLRRRETQKSLHEAVFRIFFP
jgi:hypothetical protein